MMKTADIRQAFLNYFQQQGHTIVASSSLLVKNDPSLLFTNAGMVQFKDVFLGTTTLPYTRAVSAQRCLRAGGKHNDLENVGYTARHHTFFEMLGNFSFGDYFKREAIRYAWDFLTKVLHLPPERLWVTVYEKDDESADIWLKEIQVSQERFSRCGDADNFWSMGETGPCGPCSEIFYDHGPSVPGGPPGHPGAELDRYVEIWNLVFMQYNREKDGSLHLLPKPAVDTGMGLERIAAVMQGVHSNYQTDLFESLVAAIEKKITTNASSSLYVIADHIRACAFLIADGVLPSNEGAGYVLRRIIRRAVRHGYQLGLSLPFLYTLVLPLIEQMGESYPEIVVHQLKITTVLKQEEEQFARTLAQGIALLSAQLDSLEGSVLPGEIAFKLYDTYGFPVDLTADIVRDKGLTIDLVAFMQKMDAQRARSQAAHNFHYNTTNLELNSNFHGYTTEALSSAVVGLLHDNKAVTQLHEGMQAGVILQDTPFYAESGGQVGDQGLLLDHDIRFQVTDTQRIGHAIVHYGILETGILEIGQKLSAEVDVNRRQAIRLNHTATHMLHAALKLILGPHIEQRGSLVDASRARFDFSHNQALTLAEIQHIETLVNAEIRANTPVQTTIMSLDAAKNSGAVALFDEKYAESVRVLSIGTFSKELCGGTHAERTGDLGIVKITAEYGIANGVRRLEWVVGNDALVWLDAELALLNNAAQLLKVKNADLVTKLQQTINTLKQQEKDITHLNQKLLTLAAKEMLTEVKVYQGVTTLFKKLDNLDMQSLRVTLDTLRCTLDPAVIVLYAVSAEQISVVAAVSIALQDRVPTATEWVRHICGKGGGRKDMAQGGGDIPEDLPQRIASLPTLIR